MNYHWSHIKDITIGNFMYEIFRRSDKEEIMVGLHKTNKAYAFPIRDGVIIWDEYPENSALLSNELKEQVNELV